MKALFIGRFQPFHAGHIDAIKQIKEKNIIIGIGSSQYSGTEKNPYSFAERKKMIEKALGNDKPRCEDGVPFAKKYKIIAVPDIHNPPLWVEHVKKIIGKFDVVYTGNDFTKKLFEEKKYKVKKIKKNIKISGTEIRKNNKLIMTKQQKIKRYLLQKEKLDLANKNYRRQTAAITNFLLKEDLSSKGDITTTALIKKNKTATAKAAAKENGVVAGLSEAIWLLKKNKLRAESRKKDGDKIKKGETILKISGNIKTILRTERCVLNILQRMSGIATQTARIVSLCPRILICPTRKTIWGLMDKKAVTAGGGGTHRLGLYDFILIKDNHIKSMNGDMATCARAIKKKKIFWEMEVRNEQEFALALKLHPDAIMLDNFKPAKIKKMLKKLEKKYKETIFEASGGITEKNIKKYAQTKVDIISIGSLTHSAKVLDINLKII